jgi:hypothetical protein
MGGKCIGAKGLQIAHKTFPSTKEGKKEEEKDTTIIQNKPCILQINN